MAHQVALTVEAAIKPEDLAELQDVLNLMSSNGAHNEVLPFAAIADTHFARLMVIDDCDGAPTLLLMIDCDAPIDRHLDQLVEVASDGLDRIYRHCADYPQPDQLTRQDRLRYLRSRMTSAKVFYVHTVGRTLDQILQEAELRQAIQEFLDRSQDELAGRRALEVRELVQRFVAHQPALAWARTPAARPALSFRVREGLHLVGVLLVLLVLLPLLIPAAIVWLVLLRLHELRDPPPEVRLDPVGLRQLSDREDFVVQNQISTMAWVKPGRFWRLTATAFLGIANYSARHLFNRGDLAGLKTVHFARFTRFGNPDRVLFTSYYDGSLESYMNDFIDKVAWVLNGVFGNQTGYPQTRWLFLDGARNELGFKAFLRGHQIPTQVWYSAYGDLSASNIDNNAMVRAGLYGDVTEQRAEEWLRRL